MKKTTKQGWLGFSVMVAGILTTNTFAQTPGIKGSVHDFSSNTTWVATLTGDYVNPLCTVCHTPHNAASPSPIPLWTHTTSTAAQTFKLYSSPTASAQPIEPGGGAYPTYANGNAYDTTLACLSCHDGVTAVNQYGGKTNGTSGAYFVPSWAVINDLSKMHPVDFDYDYVVTKNPAGIQPSATAVSATLSGSTRFGSQTIAQALLKNPTGSGDNWMHCSSCHDIHRTRGNAMNSQHFLVAPIAYGELCLICHIH